MATLSDSRSTRRSSVCYSSSAVTGTPRALASLRKVTSRTVPWEAVPLVNFLPRQDSDGLSTVGRNLGAGSYDQPAALKPKAAHLGGPGPVLVPRYVYVVHDSAAFGLEGASVRDHRLE